MSKQETTANKFIELKNCCWRLFIEE